jgi:bifunctional non-homologous end joining protein LigD
MRSSIWRGQDGLTDFEALRRRGAGEVAVLYAFDLIELDGDDLRRLPIETRKATLASLLPKRGARSASASTSRRTDLRCSPMPADLARRGLSRSVSARPTGPGRTQHGSRCEIRRASRCGGSAARSGTGKDRQDFSPVLAKAIGSAAANARTCSSAAAPIPANATTVAATTRRRVAFTFCRSIRADGIYRLGRRQPHAQTTR